jgi:hypothetical protein
VNSCLVLRETLKRRESLKFLLDQDAIEMALLSITKEHHLPHLDIDQLIEKKILSRHLDGSYVLDPMAFHNMDQDALGAQIAAAHWSKLRASRRDVHDDILDLWIQRVKWISNWSDAPRWMSRDDRIALLDAAYEAIVVEPDLLGWSQELERLGQESDSGFGQFPNPYWGRLFFEEPRTLIEAHMLLGRFEREAQFGHICETSRSEIDGLLAMVLRHDDPDGGYLNRYSRIQKLTLAGIERPHVLGFIEKAILRLRPEALAVLIAYPETAAFGMVMIAEHELPWDGLGDSQESAYLRAERRRKAIWEESLELFLSTMKTVGEPKALASAIHPILMALAERTVVQRNPSSILNLRARGTWKLLDITLHTLMAKGGLVMAGANLCELLGRPHRPDQPVGFRAMPLPEMKVLGWFITAPIGFPSKLGESLLAESAKVLVSLYVEEILHEIDKVSGEPTIWIDDAPAVADLPWGTIFLALGAGSFQEKLLRPLDWVGLATGLSEDAPGEDSEKTRRLKEARANKARCHLRVMIAIHQSLKIEEDRKNLETSIAGFLVQTAKPSPLGLGLFEPQFGFSSDTDDLFRKLLEVINTFTPEGRMAAIKPWIGSLGNPIPLLAALSELVSADVRALIQDLVKNLDFSSSLESIHWIPHFESLAQNAIDAGEFRSAEQVLDHVDGLIHGRKDKGPWHWFAFQMRLQLAYFQKDINAVESLEIPIEDSTNGLEGQETKQFFRALLNLEDDPVQTANVFSSLHRKHPERPANLVNLFAARLQCAKRIEDAGDRKRAFTEALNEWSSLKNLIPETERPRIERITLYNHLFALDGAQREEEFNQLWTSLGDHLRFRTEFLRLRIGNLKRLGLLEDGDKILTEAATYHNAGGGMTAEIEGMRREFEIPEGWMPASNPMLDVNQGLSLVTYQHQFYCILSLGPDDLAKVVSPHSANMEEFLVSIHAQAADELMRRMASISSLQDENKVNDLMESMVAMRLDALGLEVPGQSRGGSTDAYGTTHGGVAERDWVVRKKRCDLMIVEAFRITGSNWRGELEKHLVKAAIRYNPTGVGSILIVVYSETDSLQDILTPYRDHLGKVQVQDWVFEGAELMKAEEMPDLQVSSGIKVIRSIYRFGAESLRVFHLLLDLRPPK